MMKAAATVTAGAVVLADAALVTLGAVLIARPGSDTDGEWLLGIGIAISVLSALVYLIPRRGDEESKPSPAAKRS
jgi:hypothetical protein